MFLNLLTGFGLVHFLPGFTYVLIEKTERSSFTENALKILVISLIGSILLGYAFNVIGVVSAISYIGFVVLCLGACAVYVFNLQQEIFLFAEKTITISELAHSVVLICSLIYFLALYIEHSGQIIISWDALFSWNEWSLAFANDTLGDGIGHYPQGLPALGAILHEFTGKPEQTIWVRQIVNSFGFVGILALGVMFRPANIWSLLVGIFALLVINSNFDLIQKDYWYSFTTDVFVFIGIMAAIAAIRSQFLDDNFNPKLETSVLSNRDAWFIAIWVGLAVALAANAKQMGVVLLPVAVFAALFCTKGSFLQRMKFSFKIAVLCFVLGAGWYVYVFIEVVTDATTTNTDFLMGGVHQGRNLLERAQVAVDLMNLFTGSKLLIFLSVTALFSLFKSFGRVLWVVGFVPVLVFFLFISGYAGRNATPVLALLIMLSGIGVSVVAEFIKSQMPDGYRDIADRTIFSIRGVQLPKRFVLASCAAAFIVVLSVGHFLLPAQKIEAWAQSVEDSQTAELGWKSVNAAMIKGLDGEVEINNVFTNYKIAPRLPQLRPHKIEIITYNLENLKAILTENSEMDLFILWYDRSSKEFQDVLLCLEEKKLFALLEHRDDSTMWKYMRRISNEDASICFM